MSPPGAPKLFDGHRTGLRSAVGLGGRLVPRSGDTPTPASLHDASRNVATVEVSSSGRRGADVDGHDAFFLRTVGVMRDIAERKQAERMRGNQNVCH